MWHDLWHATQEALAGLELFRIVSGNPSLRTPLLGIRSQYAGEIQGYEWCGSDMF
jgi:hypothetical protein